MLLMKVIYIAGKYRGPNAWAIEQNIRAAEEVAARVWAMGMVALCPHANSRHMDGVASDEVLLDGTMELLKRCDAVVMVPGWGKSVGACAEYDEAINRCMPVFGIDSRDDSPPDGPLTAMAHATAVEQTLMHLRRWAEGDR
jgi:hypothetical protein